MRLLKVAIAFGLVMVIASPIWAEDETPKDRPPRDGEHKQRILEKFDEDGDGKLNDEERRAAHEARHGDDELPRGEGPRGDHRRGGERRHGPGGPDGPPGEHRRGPGRPDGPPDGRFGPPPPPMDPEQMFERLDEDGDGHLSLDEFRDGMKRMRSPGPPRGFGEGDRGRGSGGPTDGPRFRRGGPGGDSRDGRRPGRPPRPEGDFDRPGPEHDDEPDEA
jgi:hypothetical protein